MAVAGRQVVVLGRNSSVYVKVDRCWLEVRNRQPGRLGEGKWSTGQD